MKKSQIITIVILIAVVVIGVYFYFQGQNRVPTNQIDVTTSINQNTEEKLPEILGNKDDLISFSVVAGSTISGNLEFGGIVKNAYFFEGNILINILDQNKKVLKNGYANAITEWMIAGPVSFKGTIDLTGLPTGAGFIEIRNDNPSDDRSLDKSIYIPVFIL
ncbi:MAG: Gmad2 immunoglobulin-like domain-containing protein [Patescibacteria group bacterium]